MASHIPSRSSGDIEEVHLKFQRQHSEPQINLGMPTLKRALDSLDRLDRLDPCCYGILRDATATFTCQLLGVFKKHKRPKACILLGVWFCDMLGQVGKLSLKFDLLSTFCGCDCCCCWWGFMLDALPDRAGQKTQAQNCCLWTFPTIRRCNMV